MAGCPGNSRSAKMVASAANSKSKNVQKSFKAGFTGGANKLAKASQTYKSGLKQSVSKGSARGKSFAKFERKLKAARKAKG